MEGRICPIRMHAHMASGGPLSSVYVEEDVHLDIRACIGDECMAYSKRDRSCVLFRDPGANWRWEWALVRIMEKLDAIAKVRRKLF